MSRRVIGASGLALALAAAPAPARADAPTAAVPPPAPTVPDVADREIGGLLGVASGSRTTPGGLRIGGRYLYQLTDDDWFDGDVAFTFGGGGAACFRDRADNFVCDHGLLDGVAGELGAGVRRFFSGNEGFRPYVRLGAAARVVRFGADNVTGFEIPISAGAGVRVRVSDDVSVGGEAALELGPGWLGHGLGLEFERGFAIGAVAEIALR
jgi:hypothetical protein